MRPSLTRPGSRKGRRTDRDDLFADFFNAHQIGVERCAQRLVGQRLGVYEDICIEVFVIAFDRFETLALGELPPSVARGWLLRVTWNLATKEYRARSRRDRANERLHGRDVTEFVPFDELFIDTLSDDGQLAKQAREVIADLSATDRTALEAELQGPLTGKELAAALGVTHEAARTRWMRAKRNFAAEYVSRYGWPWDTDAHGAGGGAE